MRANGRTLQKKKEKQGGIPPRGPALLEEQKKKFNYEKNAGPGRSPRPEGDGGLWQIQKKNQLRGTGGMWGDRPGKERADYTEKLGGKVVQKQQR